KQELSHYGQKINIILSRLRKHITLARQQIDTAKYIQELKKLLQTPTEITVVLSFLIFPKGVPQLLFDGATKTTVCFLLLRKTKLLKKEYALAV
ncbi:sieve element occlusion protein, partial [Trifolium medium]|nr:sieve element occlusion protein [Trifolium medium]